MKITIIHGQDHEGSPCMVARELAEKVGGTGAGVLPARIQKNIHRQTDRLARQIRKRAGKHGYNLRAKKWFALMRFAHKHFPPMEPDYGYWEERGWHKKHRPWLHS